MKWSDLTKEDRDRAISEIELLARSISPHPISAILNAAAEFLQASTEEPFASQIKADMAALRLLYERWRLAPSKDTWREALSACVAMHYMIRPSHPDRKEFEAIRETLAEYERGLR